MIGSCLHEHSHLAERFRPKRLLDAQRNAIKLVKSEPHEPPVDYTALGYCWGSETDSQAQLRTDSNETKRELSLGFDKKRLPAVIKDAVEVIRSLSIPYLWVDALCIRQDKSAKNDWEEHTKIMNKIYSNAYVTIAATSSPSYKVGFLRRNNPTIYLKYHSTLQKNIKGYLKMTIEYASYYHIDKISNSTFKSSEIYRGLIYKTYFSSK